MNVLCLPGASGSREFWQPVCDRLAPLRTRVLGWPGLGGAPAQRDVGSVDDLVQLVVREALAFGAPVHLAAQSMGGVVALRVALEHPELLASLTLCATTGGLNLASLGAVDWREDAHEWHPATAPRWFLDDRSDLVERIPEITARTLLLFGDRDPLSPVAVGARLRELLPNALLRVVPAGEHDFVSVHADLVATTLRDHLNRG